MEYRDYEATLAKVHEVDAEYLPAFRARLRIIRDRAGVPVPFKAGKGQRRQFTLVDLWETHLALRLAEAGIPPARIGLLFSEWIRPKNVYAQAIEEQKKLRSIGHSDLFMVIFTHLDVGKEREEAKHDVELRELGEFDFHFRFERRNSHVQFVLNISALTGELF